MTTKGFQSELKIHIKAIIINFLLIALLIQPFIPVLQTQSCIADESGNKKSSTTESTTNITVTNSRSTSTTFSTKTTPSQSSGQTSGSSSGTPVKETTEDNTNKIGALIPIYYLNKDIVISALTSRFGEVKVSSDLSKYKAGAEFVVVETKRVAVKPDDSGEKATNTVVNSDGASVLVVCFCSKDTLNKAEQILSALDKPSSMLRLSFWVMQINGNAMDVEKVTRDISLDMAQSRAKITALFVLLRELVNRALIAENRYCFISIKDVQDWNKLIIELQQASRERSGEKLEVFNLLSDQSKRTIKDYNSTDTPSPAFKQRLISELNTIIECEDLTKSGQETEIYNKWFENRKEIDDNFSSISRFDPTPYNNRNNKIDWSRTSFFEAKFIKQANEMYCYHHMMKSFWTGYSRNGFTNRNFLYDIIKTLMFDDQLYLNWNDKNGFLPRQGSVNKQEPISGKKLIKEVAEVLFSDIEKYIDSKNGVDLNNRQLCYIYRDKEIWLSNLQPVTILDSIVILNMAKPEVRRRILTSFFLKAPLVLANVEIQFEEMKQKRTLCRNQKLAIIVNNLRTNRFIHLRRHFENLNPGILVNMDKIVTSKEYKKALGDFDEKGVNRAICMLNMDLDMDGYHYNVDAQEDITYKYIDKKIRNFKDESLLTIADRIRNIREKSNNKINKLNSSIDTIKTDLDKNIKELADPVNKNNPMKRKSIEKAIEKLKKDKYNLEKQKKQLEVEISLANNISDIGINNLDSFISRVSENEVSDRANSLKIENKINALLRNFLMALDDDISIQFIEPVLDKMRKKVRNDNRMKRTTVDISTIQRTSIMATSRYPAKVSPQAKAYFQIPEPRMTMVEIVKMVKQFKPDVLGTSVGNILVNLQKNQWEGTGTVTTITKKPLPEGLVKFSDSIGNKLCLNIAGEKILFKKQSGSDFYAPVSLSGKFISGIVIEETIPPEKDEKGKVKGKATKKVGDALFKKGENTEDVNLYYGTTLLNVKLGSDDTTVITNPGASDNKYSLKHNKDTVAFESAVDLNEVTETKVEQKDPFNNKTSIITTGMGLDLVPVVFSDGESAILRLSDLGYNFNATPFNEDEKFSVIDQHKITTLVTARTFDLLQLSEFEAQSTVTRRGQGIIPLFFVGEMVPFLRDIPFIGELFDRPSIQRSQLQRSVIFVNPMIFPVINEVLDFSQESI